MKRLLVALLFAMLCRTIAGAYNDPTLSAFSHTDTVVVDTMSVGVMQASSDRRAATHADADTVGISGTLPVLYINTEYGAEITSKTEYVNATYWLDAMGIEGVDTIGCELLPMPMQIRGRGNSSWKGEKKPYKIKLASKIPLMRMPQNKHWALLPGTDHILTGFQLGRVMGFVWTPNFRPVEVVLNDKFIGIYFITETIRIGEDRVNIYEQADLETDENLITGGWLVEVDNYPDECQITIRENSKWNLRIRYHSPDVLSDVQLNWLRNEFTTINQAIYSADKTSTDWEKYLDIESLARYFILHEILDNPDGFHGSFYLHKDLADSSKWVAGPIWDLVCQERQKTDYTFRMKTSYTFTPHWIGEIIQYDSFCRAVAKVWDELYPSRLSKIYADIDSIEAPLNQAWINNAKRWGGDTLMTAERRAEIKKEALRSNIDWFNNNLPKSTASAIVSVPVDKRRTPVRVYNLQGMCVGMYDNTEEAISKLPKGIYIINRKQMVKQ